MKRVRFVIDDTLEKELHYPRFLGAENLDYMHL